MLWAQTHCPASNGERPKGESQGLQTQATEPQSESHWEREAGNPGLSLMVYLPKHISSTSRESGKGGYRHLCQSFKGCLRLMLREGIPVCTIIPQTTPKPTWKAHLLVGIEKDRLSLKKKKISKYFYISWNWLKYITKPVRPSRMGSLPSPPVLTLFIPTWNIPAPPTTWSPRQA